MPTRVHGAFVDDHEVHAVVADWKKRGEPEYIDEILSGESSAEVLCCPGEQPEGEDQEYDAFYDEAVAFVTETSRASVSSVQRKFRIGYNRAARLVEQMEQSGVVSAPGHNGNRDVLAPPAAKGLNEMQRTIFYPLCCWGGLFASGLTAEESPLHESTQQDVKKAVGQLQTFSGPIYPAR